MFGWQQVSQRLEGNIPILDPIAAMKIKDKDFLEMHQRSRIFEDRLLAHKLHKDKKVEALCKLYHEKQEVQIAYHLEIHNLSTFHVRKAFISQLLI